jgi:hypothetical protein
MGALFFVWAMLIFTLIVAIVVVRRESMRWSVVLVVMSAVAGGTAGADCLEQVEIGDPGFVVIEKCGQPQRREREELPRSKAVELVRGSGVSAQLPQQPLLLERWYYDTSLNAATVVHLEDGGVMKKERLLRVDNPVVE